MDLPVATVAQCVIRVDDPAKSLRRLGKRSFLGWLLREFTRFGVTDFLLLTDRVPAEVETSLPHEVRVTLSPPPVGSGSGGALFHTRDQLHDRFLLCDGNALLDWNLAELLADTMTDEAEVIGRIAVRPAGTSRGMTLFRREFVDYLRPVGSLELDVLPDLKRRGLLRSTRINDCSTEAEDLLPGAGPGGKHRIRQRDAIAPLRRRALFLDRDGVLNIDHGYVGSHDRFEWVDGALDAIRYATRAGWHVFVVTNQSGVARGLYAEDDVRMLLDWMADQARAAGGTIDDVRFCPFHPEAKLDAYRRAHPWRKPLPGMLLDLIRAWELDPARAVVIGDQATDMEAAAAAGVAGHLFRGGNLLSFIQAILDQHA
jgi:D,D-heptose 1,7-bisphosphate phosphatase